MIDENGNLIKCIYCLKAGELSEEHIYPQWLKQYIDYDEAYSLHETSVNVKMPGGSVAVVDYEQRYGEGDTRSRGVHCVCNKCNNEWMSVLTDRVKPFLGPMAQGQWPKNLSAEEAHMLAAWAAMFTMSSEAKHLPTMAVPQWQRT